LVNLVNLGCNVVYDFLGDDMDRVFTLCGPERPSRFEAYPFESPFEPKWGIVDQHQLMYIPFAVASGIVFADGDDAPYLAALDAETGFDLWQLEYDDWELFPAVVRFGKDGRPQLLQARSMDNKTVILSVD